MPDQTFSFFVCDPWASYMAQLAADNDRQDREWELEADKEQEELLAREFFEDLEDDVVEVKDWPWYADAPYDVELPEIVET